jgi:hypothetical protein
MSDHLILDRRTCRLQGETTAEALLRANTESAARQLAQARENLIAARRRVVALEEAVENWLAMGQMAAAAGSRISAN